MKDLSLQNGRSKVLEEFFLGHLAVTEIVILDKDYLILDLMIYLYILSKYNYLDTLVRTRDKI